MYTAMAAAVGIDPATNATVPFNLINATWAYALDDIVLKAVEDMGMDFWWIDWQQGGHTAGCSGDKQNPTIWYACCVCAGVDGQGFYLGTFFASLQLFLLESRCR